MLTNPCSIFSNPLPTWRGAVVRGKRLMRQTHELGKYHFHLTYPRSSSVKLEKRTNKPCSHAHHYPQSSSHTLSPTRPGRSHLSISYRRLWVSQPSLLCYKLACVRATKRVLEGLPMFNSWIPSELYLEGWVLIGASCLCLKWPCSRYRACKAGAVWSTGGLLENSPFESFSCFEGCWRGF